MIGTARQKSKILAPLRYIISVNALTPNVQGNGKAVSESVN